MRLYTGDDKILVRTGRKFRLYSVSTEAGIQTNHAIPKSIISSGSSQEYLTLKEYFEDSGLHVTGLSWKTYSSDPILYDPRSLVLRPDFIMILLPFKFLVDVGTREELELLGSVMDELSRLGWKTLHLYKPSRYIVR